LVRKAIHTSDQVKAFLGELKTQSDRGVAIVAAAMLEELLELIILARLIEIPSKRKEALFDRMNAPLSSLSAKIEMAFALGIINETARRAMHLVRDVRNKFAHRLEPLTFHHPEVIGLIEGKDAMPSVKAMKKPTKEQFLDTIQALAVVLYGTLAADIRIKSLEETHQEHFLQVAMKVHSLSQAVNLASTQETPLPKGTEPKQR
jgi:DNA-binding MltR family transcriptional regulator